MGQVPAGSFIEIIWKNGILWGASEPRLLFPTKYELLPTPTETMWNDLYLTMKQIHLQQWERWYMNTDIFDGTAWEFRIRFKEIHRTIEGVNAYPEQYGLLHHQLNRLSSGYLDNTELNT